MGGRIDHPNPNSWVVSAEAAAEAAKPKKKATPVAKPVEPGVAVAVEEIAAGVAESSKQDD